MEINRKKLNILYCISQCGYWFSCCTIFGFATVFFLHRGFSASQIGMIVALGSVLGAVVQPVFADIVDKGKVELHTMIKILASALATAMLLLVFLKTQKWMIAAVFLVADILIWILMSLENSVSVYYVNRGVFLDFGIARGFGSAAFALASSVLGFLAERFSVSAIMAGGVFGMLVLMGSTVMMPILKKEGREDLVAFHTISEKKASSPGFFSFMRRYKKFTAVLLGVTLLFTFHNMNVSYSINIVQRFGGDSTQLGIAFALAAIVEIPTMFVFSKLNKRIGSNRLLILSGLFFLAKAVSFLFCATTFQFYLVQIFNFGSNALVLPSFVRYADEMMQPEDKYKGQAYVVATDALGNVLGNLLGGFIIDYQGVFVMIAVGILAALAGCILLFVNAKPCDLSGKYQKESEESGIA